MLFRFLLFAVTWLSVAWGVPGQESGDHYEALKQALGLSDAQVSRLQQRSPAALDDSQKSKLAVIRKTLDRWDAATVTIGLGLIREQQWPGSTQCMIYQIRAYASFAYATELGITPSQIEQFEQIQRAAGEPLWAQVREKDRQRSELLHSGVSKDSPAVVQLGSDIDRLQAQATARPRHDLALAVLNAAQRTKLAAFETALQAASEAIDLGLILAPPKGEFLCH